MKKILSLILMLLSFVIIPFSACNPGNFSTPPPQTSVSISNPIWESFLRQATDNDVTFTSTLSDDRLSVLIEVTPKFHICNLSIKTTFYLDRGGKNIHHFTQERAFANKTISFRIYLSEDHIKEGIRINLYDYHVSSGVYLAKESSINEVFNGTDITSDNSYIVCRINLEVNKQSAFLQIYFKENMHSLEFEIDYTDNFGRSISFQKIKLDSIDQYGTYCKLIDFPDYLSLQNIELENLRCTVKGIYIHSATNSTEPDEHYWDYLAQF